MQKCKADGGGENTEHCGRTIYTALEGREWERVYVLSAVMLRSLTTYNYLYSSDSGHALLFSIKIIIALQIGQESVKGKNKLDQLTQKTSTDKKTVLKETERQNQQTNENDLRRIVRNRSDTLNTRVAPKNNLFGYVPPKRCRDFKIPASQFSHY